MKLIGLLISVGSAAIVLGSPAHAETLFDVEHARANYRAGLISEYDAEMLRRWGAPSGYYPDSRLYRPPQYRYPPRRKYPRGRRW
jgi:hypothetical protein